MNLSHYTLKKIATDHITVPEEEMLELPEKVLQFGTGMLLRGLPDYYIDKANRQGVFNGRVVVVKSTTKGDASAFEKQDGLYTICERGVLNGQKVEKDTVSSAISRVLSAQSDWEEILACARNPDIRIIISNTTEMGIQLVKDDIRRYPPVSFPGKLLSFLYERFVAFDGSREKGFVIVPTELLPENGKKLESIVLELAHLNGVDNDFIEWLEAANQFCNSLVDRIVTGMPSPSEREVFFKNLGYRDELLTVTEAYSLWAIEGDEAIRKILSFAEADDAVKIEPDINLFRELKLRLLNGTHTFASGIGFLGGFDTVGESMEHETMSAFLETLMIRGISPSIPLKIDPATSLDFAQQVLDRFRNPHLRHHWKTIAQNYSQKMKLRCVPLLINYYTKNSEPPALFAFGFAAWIKYMKAVKTEKGQYSGEMNGEYYHIDDEMAAHHFNLWQTNQSKKVIHHLLADTAYWGHNLTLLPGFENSVLELYNLLEKEGVRKAMEFVPEQKKISHVS